MRLAVISVVLVVLGLAVVAVTVFPACGADEGMTPAGKTPMGMMAYGAKEDTDFGMAVWKAIQGYRDWPFYSDYLVPKFHQGAYVRTYYDIIPVMGMHYHALVKESLGQEGTSLDAIKMDPAKQLVIVTVMVQREMGYDPDNNDWFYAAYMPDGSLAMDGKNVPMAGRVGDGTSASCIGCHVKAMGGDFIFTNDPM